MIAGLDWFGLPQGIVLAVALQRIAELHYARRNTARLLADGGLEHGAGHYPLFFLVQGSWLVALAVLTPADAPIRWALLAVFVLLQAARLWVIATLGRYWTTRVVTLAEAPLVTGGPYRWLRHPNYAVVAAEIVVLPLVFGEWWIAAVAGLATAFLLRHRIAVEESALASRRAGSPRH